MFNMKVSYKIRPTMIYLILVSLFVSLGCYGNSDQIPKDGKKGGFLLFGNSKKGFTNEDIFISSDCETVYISPNGENPSEDDDIYAYPLPLKEDMRVENFITPSNQIYVDQKECVLFNNGKWVEFPYVRVSGAKGSSLLYDALSIVDVEAVAEELFLTDPYDYLYDFKVSCIKVSVVNNSENDIMLLHCMYFEHYKEWKISEVETATGRLHAENYNIYLPAKSTSVIHMKILPPYELTFAYESKGADLHRPKKVLDYRYEKGRDIHLQLFFFTCFYGEDHMRSSSVPFVLRYKGKLK